MEWQYLSFNDQGLQKWEEWSELMLLIWPGKKQLLVKGLGTKRPNYGTTGKYMNLGLPFLILRVLP